MARNETVKAIQERGGWQQRMDRYVNEFRMELNLAAGESITESRREDATFHQAGWFEVTLAGLKCSLYIHQNRHGRLEAKWTARSGNVSDNREFTEGKHYGFDAKHNLSILRSSAQGVAERAVMQQAADGTVNEIAALSAKIQARGYLDWNDGRQQPRVEIKINNLTHQQAMAHRRGHCEDRRLAPLPQQGERNMTTITSEEMRMETLKRRMDDVTQKIADMLTSGGHTVKTHVDEYSKRLILSRVNEESASLVVAEKLGAGNPGTRRGTGVLYVTVGGYGEKRMFYESRTGGFSYVGIAAEIIRLVERSKARRTEMVREEAARKAADRMVSEVNETCGTQHGTSAPFFYRQGIAGVQAATIVLPTSITKEQAIAALRAVQEVLAK